MKTWRNQTLFILLCLVIGLVPSSAKSTYSEANKNEKAITGLQDKLSDDNKKFQKKEDELKQKIVNEKDGKKKAKLEKELAELLMKFEGEKSELLRRIDSLKNVPLEGQTKNTKSVVLGGPCGNLASLTGDPRRVIESHGPPQDCEYFPSQRADLRIMSPSAELQSSRCWVNGAYVFEGPSIMIFKYFDVNPPLIIVFVDMSVIASYSYGNFNESRRDQTLLTICPPGQTQILHSDISGWHEVNFAGDQGSSYESVLANLFGAGGGGALYRGGFEGMQMTAKAQMRDDFKFRNILLDKRFMILLNKEEAVWTKISNLFGEVISPVGEKIAIREARVLALEREGEHGDAERLRKELRGFEKKKDDLLEPMTRAERSLQSYDFANPAVRDAIDFLAKNLPQSERSKIDGPAQEYKSVAAELRDAMEKIKLYLGREFNPEILSEPRIDLVPPETAAGLVAVAGATYDFETQKPKLKLKVRESFRSVKTDGSVDKYTPAIRKFRKLGVFVDDLLQEGFTKAQTMCKKINEGENGCIVSVIEGDGISFASVLSFPDQDGVVSREVNLRDLKEGGTLWFPIAVPRKEEETTRPFGADKFLDTFDFNDGEGHNLTVFVIDVPTMMTDVLLGKNGERVEFKFFLSPGEYYYEFTVVDALATDLAKREICLPAVPFRIEPPMPYAPSQK